MAHKLRIDLVSDVVCPWCVIGLRSLEQALARLDGEVEGEIVLHPFELNPDMPPEGEDVADHVRRKYGASPERFAATRAAIRDSAAAVGFDMPQRPGARITNTFDAHRLLHWAQHHDRQLALKHALLDAYFTRGENTADRAVLLAAVRAAGLPEAEAREVLESGRYAEEVRAEQHRWRVEGVDAVPTLIVDDRYVIAGAHPVEALEKALRRIAQSPAPELAAAG